MAATSQKKREKEIDDFFVHYSALFNNAVRSDAPETEATAAVFATCFIAADLNGVNCGQNNEAFREAMSGGYKFYKSIGIISMDIASTQITLLDDFHAMAKVKWKSIFHKKDGSTCSIKFENIYFVQTRHEQHKVFAYITADEQAALKEAGLI